jgi:hypothetical protein
VLRIKLEIVPFGQEESTYSINEIFITNKGTDGLLPKDEEGSTWRYYHVSEHDPRFPVNKTKPKYIIEHKREDGALVLLEKAIAVLNKAEQKLDKIS